MSKSVKPSVEYPVYQGFGHNLGKNSEMIIFWLLLTTFVVICVFLGQIGYWQYLIGI